MQGKSPLDNLGMFKDDAEQKALGWEMARQRDCHFTDVLSASLLMRLLKVEGGAAE